MPLSFIKDLDEQQSQLAVKIAERAKELGVDPKLAVAVAYRESRLRPDVANGADGEIGLMQIKPDTGKTLGYKVEDLKNTDTNIDAGLKYLKFNLNQFDNDAKLAAVGYNAGPNHPFFNGGELPKSTESYVKDLKEYGAFTVTPKEAPKPSVEVSDTDFANKLLEGGTELAEKAGQKLLSPEAVAGAELGAGMGAAKGAKDILQELRAANTGAPTNSSGVQNWTREMGYGERGAKTYSQAHQFEQGTRQGAKIGGIKPTFRVEKPPIIQPTGAQRAVGALESAGKVMTKLPPVSGAAFGALGGLGAVSGADEARSRLQQGDVPGAAIAGVGALGSAASIIPHPMTRAIGTGVSMASPAALMVLDKMREQSAKQPQRALQNVDAMGNPLP